MTSKQSMRENNEKSKMVEAGSSTNAEQGSASENQDSQIRTPDNQESMQDMIQILATKIENMKSEINLYSSRVSENQKKLEQIQVEMQLKIDQDKSKELELKKKLDSLMKAQLHLIDSCKENANQEIQTDQQDTVNEEINLPTTSRGCNNQRNSVQVAQSTSQAELIESARRKSGSPDNIDDEVSSQNISDNTSVSSYRPSVHTQSTETQSIEEVNFTRSNLAWDIACQKLLHSLQENKDSYHFREPVDEKIYKDYRKYVLAPLCLRDVEESFKSGVYKSPLDFSKDMRIIFYNSRKYNTDKTALIYKQTTRLKNLYEEQMKEIMSNWRASKKSRTSNSSKRKINDPADDSETDDDSQSRLKCRPKKRRHFLSDDESSLKSASVIDENSEDDNGDEDDNDVEPISTRLRNAKRKARKMQDNNLESSESDTEEDNSFSESSDEDQSNAYEDDSTSMDEEMEYENPESLTSESTIEKFECGNFVTITGKVCKVFTTVLQPSRKKGKDFRLFKFLLQSKEGRRNVECVAWEDEAIHCQSIIRRNQVITLENVKVKSDEGNDYNHGNFEFQLILYNTSNIITNRN